jgi:hypothetical protein
MFGAHMFAAIGIDAILTMGMIYLLHARYRVSQSGDGAVTHTPVGPPPGDPVPTASLVD